MFLNSENTKIIDYLNTNALTNFADGYLELLSAGKKIDKKELKIISRFVRDMQKEDLTKKLLDVFSRFEIDVTVQDKKNILSKSSNSRVKKYREDIRSKGYKNLSLQLSPDDFQKLKHLKIKNQMTYAELIIFLVDNYSNT
jgi:hypothetical protein